MMNKTLACIGLLLLAAAAAPAAAEEPALGRIHFPNSGAAEAQEPFLRGVLLLHNFEYEDARAAFREARASDPGFALAAWGEAMTHNHPIWQRQEQDAGRAALEALAPTAAERRAKAPSERERAWLGTVEALFFGDGDKQRRDRAYLDAVRRLHERWPDDHEAAAFHALALLGSAHEGRDFATYMRAAAVAEEVFRDNPEHPGALHYLIHAYDDPIHAPLGLRAARIYARVAPEAAHAQHMTSHIFVALGMWDEVIAANRRATDVENAARARRGEERVLCGHYPAWLHYGLLQSGRTAEASEVLARCHERIAGGGTKDGEQWYFARMRARQLFDGGAWDGPALAMDGDLDASPVARHNHRFATAYAAIERGDADTARRLAGEMAEIRAGEESDALEIEGLELDALLAIADGDPAAGLAKLRQAAEREEAMPFMFGPPPVVKPAWELLGEALLAHGPAGDAITAFRSALARAPRRVQSLRGLARAAEAAGDSELAAEAETTIISIQGR